MLQDLKYITSIYENNGGKGELLRNFYPNFELKSNQEGGAIYIVYNFPKEKERLHQYLIYIKNGNDIIVINVFAKNENILNEESLNAFIKSIEIK